MLDNNGNYFSANYAIQAVPTITYTDEECGSSNATIIASGFNPGSLYSVSYNDDTVAIAAADYQADFNGDITITSLDAGTYDGFSFTINGCTTTEASVLNIVNFSPSITGVTNNGPVCFGEDVEFYVTATPDFDIDYTINGGTTETVTVDTSGVATIVVSAPAVGNVDLALLNVHNDVCNIPDASTSSVVVNPISGSYNCIIK